MNAEQHRRLIGNDVVFIIFHEEGKSFDPGPLDAVGTVPQVFIVVQPFDNSEYYRIGVFTRPNIKPYLPYIPAKYSFHHSDLKNFLFTKVYNGYCQALSCPPMNRLFEVPRGSTISELGEKYITINKQRPRERKPIKPKLDEDDPSQIYINVIGANFESSNNIEPFDAYCIVTIADQKQKTKPQKKTLVPRWNTPLSFSLQGINTQFDYINIEIKDANKKGNCLGRLELSFLELCTSDSEQWFKLTNELGEEIQFLVGLSYEVKGNGKDKCPMCGIIIGEDPCVFMYSEILHTPCLACTECGKNKKWNELIYRNGRYYDSVCFDRRFGSTDASNYTSKLYQSHNWTQGTLSYTNLFCSNCGQPLRDTPVKCQECSFTCHNDCKAKTLSNCIPKSEQLVSKGGYTPLIPNRRQPLKVKKN